MLLLITGVFIVISLLTASLLVYAAEKAQARQRIQLFVTEYGSAVPVEEETSFYQRMIAPLWKKTKKKQQRKWNKQKARELEIKLLKAGQPFGLSPVAFQLLQKTLLLVLPLLGIGFALLFQAGMAVIFLFAVIGFAAALLYPKQLLSSRTKARSKQALKEMPDTLDLLTISLEAGLGFDAALSKVVEKKSGILAQEFKIYLEEIRLGKTRRNALDTINERVELEELKALIYSINQAEKLGIGMVSVLRVQTEDIREKRKQRAEEAAMKAPVKMLFPLVIFIFPTIFIILLGPAALQMMDVF